MKPFSTSLGLVAGDDDCFIRVPLMQRRRDRKQIFGVGDEYIVAAGLQSGQPLF